MSPLARDPRSGIASKAIGREVRVRNLHSDMMNTPRTSA